MIKLVHHLFVCITIACCSYTYAADEITVSLDTEKQPIPIFIKPFANDNSGLSKDDVQILEKTFRFDFEHNGVTTTAKIKKPEQALYVIEISLKEHKLNARVISNENSTEKIIEGLVLTGYLDRDRKLIHQLSDTIYKAVFGNDGIASTRILYSLKTKENGKDVSEIWEADYDGGNPRQITRNSGYAISPVYIPPKVGASSGSFFYVSYLTGQPKIFVASLSDGIGRRLSSIKGVQLMPAISKQRDQVAFISDISGTTDLFIQQFSPEQGLIGKPRQLFSGKSSTQGSPTFSPDGKQMAFVSDKDGSPRIYVLTIPPSGTALKDIKTRQISTMNQENTAPSWSPDGSKLAYCSRTNGIRQIWIYDFKTNQESQLTKGPDNKENPTWAPNSMHLIYNTSDVGNSELYLINTNFPLPIKINPGAGEKKIPCWEPGAEKK